MAFPTGLRLRFGGRHLIADFLAESISRIPAGSCDHDLKDLFAIKRRYNASNLIFAIFERHE
jgi:hypothetical protein